MVSCVYVDCKTLSDKKNILTHYLYVFMHYVCEGSTYHSDEGIHDDDSDADSSILPNRCGVLMTAKPSGEKINIFFSMH